MVNTAAPDRGRPLKGVIFVQFPNVESEEGSSEQQKSEDNTIRKMNVFFTLFMGEML
jgi:hypothetical protein